MMWREKYERLFQTIRQDDFTKSNISDDRTNFISYGNKAWVKFKTKVGLKAFAERIASKDEEVESCSVKNNVVEFVLRNDDE